MLCRRGILTMLVLTALAAGGCHVGSFSAAIDSDTMLPVVEFSAVPEQWEPPIENSAETDDDPVYAISMAAFWFRKYQSDRMKEMSRVQQEGYQQ